MRRNKKKLARLISTNTAIGHHIYRFDRTFLFVLMMMTMMIVRDDNDCIIIIEYF
mgnify:CR=1 FL=1